MSKNITKRASGRLLALDYLRGFFIVVIIIDHMWRFPSLGALLSGQAKLWVTAAEGFVIISGFLIGYIRGYKGLRLPFSVIARTLALRSLMLYGWLVIASLTYVWIEWSGVVHSMPYTPTAVGGVHDWHSTLTSIMTFEHPHTWVHFLYLYAIFLAISIPVVWLFRHKLSWVIALGSLLLYWVGLVNNVEWFKWQIIFFLPSIAGFYFETIQSWWRTIGNRNRRMISSYVTLFALCTVLASILVAFIPSVLPAPAVEGLGRVFMTAAFSPLRVIVALLWFTALALLFQQLTPWLKHHTFGVLEYIGTHSLTAYISHGLIICLVNLLLPDSTSIIVNTLYNLVAILAVYYFIRLPIVRKVLPR